MDTPIFLVFAFLVLLGPSCTNSDNLDLLAGTLRTTQRLACDDEIVSLSCANDTFINIQLARYGNIPEGRKCISGQVHVNPDSVEEYSDCLRPNAMQYSLLQTVVEACQKKPKCEFSTRIKPGIVDPCPKAGKIVEVAFKCRPHEFTSRTVCQGDVIELFCNPKSRLVIYDAQYGRAQQDSPNTCQQNQGVMDDICSAPYALKTTMQICHGKQHCQIVADKETFGSPCRPDSRAYLKVQYTCVPLGVLTDKYENTSEENKIVHLDSAKTYGQGIDQPDNAMKGTGPVDKGEEIPRSVHATSNRNIAYKVSDMASKTSYLKLLIYISIATIVVIGLAAIIIGIRCYKQKKRENNSKNGDMFTTEAPNVFNDDASDLDNDVDVSHISGTFYDPVHPDMILYRDGPNKTTLRAMRPLNTVYPCAGASMYGNADYVPSHSRDNTRRYVHKEVDSDIVMSPKSLSGYTNTQFYYG